MAHFGKLIIAPALARLMPCVAAKAIFTVRHRTTDLTPTSAAAGALLILVPFIQRFEACPRLWERIDRTRNLAAIWENLLTTGLTYTFSCKSV